MAYSVYLQRVHKTLGCAIFNKNFLGNFGKLHSHHGLLPHQQRLEGMHPLAYCTPHTTIVRQLATERCLTSLTKHAHNANSEGAALTAPWAPHCKGPDEHRSPQGALCTSTPDMGTCEGSNACVRQGLHQEKYTMLFELYKVFIKSKKVKSRKSFRPTQFPEKS
ncbi:hypothetical protein BC826DRAFT_351540 [Russula brevipes]|nr:hypothetical protein BC826DRAFT_351540 [Russula brevipes]